MHAIEPCPNRTPGNRGMKGTWNYVINSTSKDVTTTVVMPAKSTSSTRTSTPGIQSILPPSSLGTSSKTLFSSGRTSSFIIGIVVAVIVLIFIVAACLAWYRRRSLKTSSAGNRPALLPKFSFERENKGPPKTSGTLGDKFTRLPAAYSPGVMWVADKHSSTKHGKASRGSMLLFAKSFGPSLTKATVVSTFITDHADELPVAVGQKLNILAKYDDGWSFCVNERGEQGMVPVECWTKA